MEIFTIYMSFLETSVVKYEFRVYRAHDIESVAKTRFVWDYDAHSFGCDLRHTSDI